MSIACRRNHFSACFSHLSAVEILRYQFKDFFWILLDILTQRHVVEGTQLGDDAVDHGHRGNLCKWVEICRPLARQHVEIAGTGLYEREKAAAIHAFATGEDGIEIAEVVDDEIQCFQSSVACRIHEVHHADVVLHNVVDNVSFGKFFDRLSEECHNRISIQSQMFVIHITNCIDLILFFVISYY